MLYIINNSILFCLKITKVFKVNLGKIWSFFFVLAIANLSTSMMYAKLY